MKITSNRFLFSIIFGLSFICLLQVIILTQGTYGRVSIDFSFPLNSQEKHTKKTPKITTPKITTDLTPAPSCDENPFEKFLPHLKCQNEPGTEFGQLRAGLKYLLGIPTVRRSGQSYLTQTLTSIFKAQKSDLDFGVVIFVGDPDPTYVKDLAKSLEETFPDSFLAQQLVIISPPENFYPNFTAEIDIIKGNKVVYTSLNDDAKRMKWRMKVS